MKFSKHKLCVVALTVALAGPVFAGAELKTFAEFNDTRPGNITITPDNRVIVTQQPLDSPSLRVVEVLEDGSKVPFPTPDWADGPEAGETGFAATIGIDTDSNGIVWVLDMGAEGVVPKFVGWDTTKNTLHKIIEIPSEVTVATSFLQDFAIDEKNGNLIIADMTFTAPASAMQPAFVIVDMETGEARRVLQSSDALMPVERDVVIDGKLMGFKDGEGNTQPWHLAMNAISIDPAFEFVYFGAINGEEIFRIPAAALADETLDDAALATQIEVYGKKGPNDGFIVDEQGRVFSGDTTRNAVTVSTGDEIEIFAQDDTRLRWPDGFAFAPDGTLFIVANQLNTHPALNAGENGSDNRYFILTTRP